MNIEKADERETAASDERSTATRHQRLKWWSEARFGMFIHWGLYAVPAGEWDGQECSVIGEWIMHHFRIPIARYEQLARQFNPVKFDAGEWVRIAKDAGMKYIVITAKHHDGFAMYGSQVSPYNIVDATPFRRDPLKELAAACHKAGIRLCFYYSQSFDWHEPDAPGNNWDFPDESKKDFARYLREKVKPQLRELLTGYGPIGLIWFDCPVIITKEQSIELRDFVHGLQPECLVSGRIGHDVGDYGSLGDNEIPVGGPVGHWETPATLNDTWGFKAHDHNWKSLPEILGLLSDLAGKGVNYLLNVGPTAEGVIPAPSVERLAAVGRWMRANGEAIYGTARSPFPYEHPWGRITCKSGALYLSFAKWPGETFVLQGLRNTVTGASLLADPAHGVEVAQRHDAARDEHCVTLRLPATPPDAPISVLRLTFDGMADADPMLIQQSDGSIQLPAALARRENPMGKPWIWFTHGGVVANWLSTDNWLTWEVRINRPGRFDIGVILKAIGWGEAVVGGHRVAVTVAGETRRGCLDKLEAVNDIRARVFPEAIARLGAVEVALSGICTITLKAEEIVGGNGLNVAAVCLSPVRGMTMNGHGRRSSAAGVPANSGGRDRALQ